MTVRKFLKAPGILAALGAFLVSLTFVSDPDFTSGRVCGRFYRP